MATTVFVAPTAQAYLTLEITVGFFFITSLIIYIRPLPPPSPVGREPEGEKGVSIINYQFSIINCVRLSGSLPTGEGGGRGPFSLANFFQFLLNFLEHILVVRENERIGLTKPPVVVWQAHVALQCLVELSA